MSPIAVRNEVELGFCYTEHRTVDAKHNLITDCHIATGTASDALEYIPRLDHQIERFGFVPEFVGLDAGYALAHVAKALEDRGIKAAIPYRRPTRRAKGMLRKSQFRFDAETNRYICPNGKLLTYKNTDREGKRQYQSNRADCASCPLLPRCHNNKNGYRLLSRSVWQDSLDAAQAFTDTAVGAAIYKRRKETVERSFADSKQLHNMRSTRFRGLQRVQAESYLAAAAQNIKKMALIFGAKSQKALT